eukprot:9171496-Pyramimonas_sp.AAC.1
MSKLCPIFEGARDRTDTLSPPDLKKAKRKECNKKYRASAKGQAATKRQIAKNNPKRTPAQIAKYNAKNNAINNPKRS